MIQRKHAEKVSDEAEDVLDDELATKPSAQ